jgi:peptide/nickel transport system permease protein
MTSVTDGELQPQPLAAGDGGIDATPDGAIRRRRSAKLIVGLGILCIYVIMAVLAPVVAPYNPLAQQIPDALAHPSLHHLLGTDQLGRDVLSRIIYGARVDLVAATAASVGACVVGTLIGLLTGYAGGWVDVVLTRVMDMVQTIPSFTLLLVLLLVLGPGARSLVIALIVTHWVVYARLIRGSVLTLRSQDFISAAWLAGLRVPRILLRHLLPNVGRQAVTYLASDIILAVTAIASLGYLGIGIQPPTAEWGSMINDGQDFLSSNWWLSVAPGVVVVLLGLGLALVSDSFNERKDRL